MTSRSPTSNAGSFLSRAALLLVLGAAIAAVIGVGVTREVAEDETLGRGTAFSSIPGEWASPGKVPLSPRRDSLLLTDGSRVFVIGGRELGESLSSASPSRDGAALELSSGEWRGLPELPVELANPVGVIAGHRLVVTGIACESFDSEVGSDSCKPGGAPLFELPLDAIDAGWNELPPLTEDQAPILTAVGVLGDSAVMQTALDGPLTLISPKDERTTVELPDGYQRGAICAAGDQLLAVDVDDAARAEIDAADSAQDASAVTGTASTVARISAWALEPATGSWSDAAATVDEHPSELAFTPVCTSDGAIVAATTGQDAARFDSVGQEWTPIEDIPVEFGADPSVSSWPGHVLIAVDDMEGQTQTILDTAKNRWSPVHLPEGLRTARLNAVDSTDAITVATSFDGAQLILWARTNDS